MNGTYSCGHQITNTNNKDRCSYCGAAKRQEVVTQEQDPGAGFREMAMREIMEHVATLDRKYSSMPPPPWALGFPELS